MTGRRITARDVAEALGIVREPGQCVGCGMAPAPPCPGCGEWVCRGCQERSGEGRLDLCPDCLDEEEDR